jgi:thiol:disulfide interchange protein DsbD
MLGFAVALAIPFTFFAFFPSLLKSMPKSGGWLNQVKIILAFLELALALKFLSVADLAYGWGILDREVFVSLWIIIFALLGFYLLGKIRFPHDSETKHTSVLGTFLAIISLSFALYMVPGLWGAPLKAISAFTPPLTSQDFNLYKDEVHAKFLNYEEGMKYAKSQGKPVVIDFTGYGCVNCRKMEASVWTNPEVKKRLDNDFVLISLYVDDKTSLKEPFEVVENGKSRKIKTIGDKWSYLQRIKFGANAQPYYVMLDEKGDPLTYFYEFDDKPENFLNWLNKK